MSFGIPYMGSKQKIAQKIMGRILLENQQARHFYDLFGGGGAMSFAALNAAHFKTVIYNELNTGVVELLKKICRDGVTKEFYQWVDRETFKKNLNDDSWTGGLIKTCWSFGNGQKGYLFGKNIEQYKKWYHEIVVDGVDNTAIMANFCVQQVKSKYGIDCDLTLKMPIGVEVQARRMEMVAQLRNFERSIKSDFRFESLAQLEGLQRLQRLEKLGRLERLDIRNQSYENVIIDTPPDSTVIYLDPPYKDTKAYQKTIDNNALLKWVKASPYKIYVSEYKFDLPCVFEIHGRSTFGSNAKKTVERLFCNKP